MANLNETYENISHKGETFKERATAAIRENFAFLILLLNIVVSVAFRLFSPWVDNPFTPDFFISLATNILTSMFSYCIFISYGEKMEKLAMSGYSENCKLWSKISGQVRTTMSAEFEAYCRERALIEREERRRAIIENNTMISFSVFESEYRGRSKQYIQSCVKSGALEKRDARYVLRANRQPDVKPINPLIILCGIKLSTLNDAGRDGISPSTISVISRPVGMFILNALVSMIHGHWAGISTGEEIFDMIFSVLMIIISSVMGYSSGVSSARKEHNKIKGRIFFLENFIKEKAPAE